MHTYNDDDSDRSRLLAGLKKIVHVEMAAMPPPDFDHYLFIFHFVPDIAMGDGMEHLNSTQIIIQGSVRDSTQEALETAAHEFFHLWNVKRLRPAALGTFRLHPRELLALALGRRGHHQLLRLPLPSPIRTLDARAVPQSAGE